MLNEEYVAVEQMCELNSSEKRSKYLVTPRGEGASATGSEHSLLFICSLSFSAGSLPGTEECNSYKERSQLGMTN